MLIGVDASRAATRERTGTENYSLNLIRHLLALERGHRYRLYFNQPPAVELFPMMADLDLRVMPFPRLWTHLRLSWEMARHPPDVLFVPAHVLPLVHPRSSVVTVHDLGYLYYPGAHRPLDRLYLDLSTRYNARAASRVIAVSQATKDDLVRRCGLEADKITVVYSGCDGTMQPVEDEATIERVKAHYGIRGDYILYVGTLQPRKNLGRLLEAYAMLRKQARRGERPCLVIAGRKGWLYGQIFQQVERLGLGTEVIFPGYVSQDDLPVLLSGARLFVFPSLYEGFGLPVLEAMACGTPVLCSNVSSLPEVAGDAALLIDPLDVKGMAEAMGRLLQDGKLRTQLVERGFRQVRQFSWERCARETLAVLEDTL
ncbi:MAG TPA: glycosyltransferase family 1 protein [Anaerolineae bacterium]|nr:glycosyltransferase family 1 protein [Anaerolineae bacterium]